MVLTLSFVGCEKMNEDALMMEEYYIESTKLSTYTHEEVQAFGDDFYSFVSKRPGLKDNCYYIPTCQNLDYAGYEYRAILWGNDEWKGEIEYNP